METFEELKLEVDTLTHEQMCRMWRFSSGNPKYFDNREPISEYFKDRLFQHFGGFTPEISKQIGWG
jgi:MoxR-like ATPase